MLKYDCVRGIIDDLKEEFIGTSVLNRVAGRIYHVISARDQFRQYLQLSRQIHFWLDASAIERDVNSTRHGRTAYEAAVLARDGLTNQQRVQADVAKRCFASAMSRTYVRCVRSWLPC